MNFKNLLTLIFVYCTLISTESRAQCSATIQDTLLPGFNLQLVGIATGVPPFTYTWTVTGLVTGPITYQSNSMTGGAGDSIWIGANDLFGNYGCINVNLCITDSVGCNTCAGDTMLTYPDAAPCYASFSYTEVAPGTIQINLNYFVPPNVGMTMGTYTDANGNIGFLNDFAGWWFTYAPSNVDTNGYDIPLCVQTNFFYTPSVLCIFCDTIHISPILGVDNLEKKEPMEFSVFPNPAQDYLQLTVNQNDFSGIAELYNLTGVLVRSYNLTNPSERIDLKDVENGAYLIRLTSQNVSETKFFVKRE